MYQILLLMGSLVLANAAPGHFQHQTRFQQSSMSFRNNELQHKAAEAGFYAKQGDTDSEAPPQEVSSYVQKEYRNPDSVDNTQTPLDLSHFLDDLKKEHEQGFGNSFHSSGSQRHYSHSINFENSSNSFSSGNEHNINLNRPLRPLGQRKPTRVSGERLEEIRESSAIDNSRFQAYGFGKDYLENTEGQQIPNREKPGSSWHSIVQPHPGIRPSSESHTSHNDKDLNQQTQFSSGKHDQDNAEQQFVFDTTHQTDDEYMTQQTQDGFGKLEFGNKQQEDLSQQTQGNFDKIEFGTSQQHADVGQQTQNNFGKLEFGGHEGITQEIQDGFGKLEFGNQQHEVVSEQTQQGFGRLEFGNQQHRNINQQHRNTNQQHRNINQQIQQNSDHMHLRGQQHEDMTQQTQDGFGNISFGSQHQEDLTQQTQDGFGKLEFGGQQHEHMIQQMQDGYGKLEFGNQEQEGLTQQSQNSFGKLESESVQEQSHFMQHSGSSWKLESENHKFDGKDQETQDGYRVSEFGPAVTIQKPLSFSRVHMAIGIPTTPKPQRERTYVITLVNPTTTKPLTGSSQRQYITSFSSSESTSSSSSPRQHSNSESTRLTPSPNNYEGYVPKSMAELEGIEWGRNTNQQNRSEFNDHNQKQEHLTQQTQDGYGKLEFESQHEDMTQQTQDGFGKLQFGSQHQEDLTQKTQDGFGKLEFGGQQHEDMTQQTQDGFEKLQFGGQHQETQQTHGSGKLQFGNQQIQDGFGKLEFGGQQQEDLTQQTQDEFGKLEFGGQQHEDMTQQTQDGFGKIQFGNEHQEDLTQQTQDSFGRLEFGNQQEIMTQQTQDGFGKLEFGGQQQKELTQQTQDGYGKLELGSQDQELHGPKPVYIPQKGGSRRHQSFASSSVSSAHSHSYQESYQGQTLTGGVHPKQVTEDIDDVETKNMADIEEFAKKLLSQHSESEKTVIDESSNKEFHYPVEELVPIQPETTTTVKPSFWRRVGGSITSTFETAKEKTKKLAEKVKENLG